MACPPLDAISAARALGCLGIEVKNGDLCTCRGKRPADA